MSEAFQESTNSLFRPHQVEQTKDEIKRLEGTLNAPPHIAAQIQDRGEMTRQLRSLRRNLDQQAPKPYEISEKDSAVARSEQLKAEILEGMPTQAEMRRNPAGAVDKHRKWEKHNKLKILEWKNIQLRRHAGGDLDELPDPDLMRNAAYAHFKLGHLEEAERLYRRTILAVPEDPAARYELAQLYEQTGRPAEAKTEYERLLNVSYDIPDVHLAYANLMLQMGFEDLAGKHFMTAEKLRAHPRESEPLRRMAPPTVEEPGGE